MSIQIDKALGKISHRSYAFALLLVAGAIILFLSKRQAPDQKTVESNNPKVQASGTGDEFSRTDSKVKTLADEVKEIPRNYYDQLPPLETVIAELKLLESTEIDEKIKEVEQDLAKSELIEKSNANMLDEAGFRHLAHLLQLSDALYNVKIDRQLSSLEGELGIKKKGA